MNAGDVLRGVWRSLRQSRSVRRAVVLGVFYVAMDVLSSEGSVHLDAVALGVACLGARVVGRVLLPLLVGYGLARVGSRRSSHGARNPRFEARQLKRVARGARGAERPGGVAGAPRRPNR